MSGGGMAHTRIRLSELDNSLDSWIVSACPSVDRRSGSSTWRLTIFQAALKPVLPFLDDASNWYVRRSTPSFLEEWRDQRQKQRVSNASLCLGAAEHGPGSRHAVFGRGAVPEADWRRIGPPA
jgi:isoleucyl-tRNA synthetase